MAYREDARGELAKGRFWYGPFPLTGQLAGLVAAFLVLAPLAVSIATQKQSLLCDRETGRCVYESTNLFGERRSTSFLIAEVSEVRLVQGTGKQKSSAECVLVFRSGRDFRLPSEPAADALAEHAQLQSFFAGGIPRVHEEHEASSTTKLFLIGLALVVGLFGLASLGKVLPVRVHVFRDRVWIPRTKRRFDVHAATKVAVEVHPEHEKLRRVAVLSGEDVDFVLSDGRGGIVAHQRAARKLGALLELPVELGPDPISKTFQLPKFRKKLPRHWKLALASFVLIVLGSGALAIYSSRSQGTLEIDCKGRCRFGNLECLSGGSVSMSEPPGTFTIETWAPDEPTHWKKNSVPIQVGVTTKFVCPPTE